MSLPEVVSRDEWLVARKGLLAEEKELTRRRDALNAERRRLPMVEVTKEYVFHDPEGEARLLDRSRAAARPRWRTSRARPWRRSSATRRRRAGPSPGTRRTAATSTTTSRVTLDESVAPLEYNYRPLPAEAEWEQPFEMPGASYSLRDGERVFHTYSTYARGAEQTGGSYYWLDLTALGRQEEWEEPKGRAEAAHAASPDFAA